MTWNRTFYIWRVLFSIYISNFLEWRLLKNYLREYTSNWSKMWSNNQIKQIDTETATRQKIQQTTWIR